MAAIEDGGISMEVQALEARLFEEVRELDWTE